MCAFFLAFIMIEHVPSSELPQKMRLYFIMCCGPLNDSGALSDQVISKLYLHFKTLTDTM